MASGPARGCDCEARIDSWLIRSLLRASASREAKPQPPTPSHDERDCPFSYLAPGGCHHAPL